MSNCCGVVIVKAHNNFYVGIVPGVVNFEPEKFGSKGIESFVSLLAQNGTFVSEDEARSQAEKEEENFVRDFGCYPQYETFKWDVSHLLNS